jgi:murein DD-endopeptidase MepM/ murein hydrolase activator NlpD
MRHFLVGLLAASAFTTAVSAQSLKPNEVMSTLSVRPLADAHPVLGSDNRVHLAYELLVTNPSNFFITVDKVDAVSPTGENLATMSGDGLARMTTRYSGTNNLLPPGQTETVFMDVSLDPKAVVPKTVLARITVSRQAAKDGQPAPFPSGSPVPATVTFTAAPVNVGAPARVISSPLRGSGWLAVNGCCDSITSHRGAVIAVNGIRNAPERFAIDWVQLNKSRRMYEGDGHKLSSFAFYGDPIYSVADGVVVNTYDEADEQVPLEPAKGLVAASIGGNMMVVDIGGGAYAFYAHLQRGSLKANLGDRVKKGQVLGLLGNTGNTDAPHLHFHLMDGTSPLNANGLPFVIDHFTSEGVLPADQIDPMFAGKAVTLDNKWSGEHVNQLPLNNEVVDFH